MFQRHALAPLSAAALALAARPVQAQGLDRARTVLEQFQSELTTIIPIAAALILLCLGVAYAWDLVEKDTFIRWGVGVIIAGSAVQITALMFGS